MEPFADIENDPRLCCMGDCARCVCSHKEMVVRQYAAGGTPPRPFTAEEREALVSDADWAGEGFYNRSELEAMSDQDLASATLNAWRMYAQSNS